MSKAARIGYNVGLVKLAYTDYYRSTQGDWTPLVSAVSPLWGGALAANAPELEGLDRERVISHIAAMANARGVVPALKGMGIGAVVGGGLGLAGGSYLDEPALGGILGLLYGSGLGAGIGGMGGRYVGARKAFAELARKGGDPDASVTSLY